MFSSDTVAAVCEHHFRAHLARWPRSTLTEDVDSHLASICYAVSHALSSGRFTQRWCPRNGYRPENIQTLHRYVVQVVHVYHHDWEIVAALKAKEDDAWKMLRETSVWLCVSYLSARGWRGEALLDQAEALAQEGLLRLWQGLDRYLYDVPFHARWCTTVYNVMREFFRRYHHEYSLCLQSELLENLADRRAADPVEHLILHLRLREAIERLPTPAQRQIILLDLQDDPSGRAAANSLGISPQAVYSLRYRARERLRALLAA